MPDNRPQSGIVSCALCPFRKVCRNFMGGAGITSATGISPGSVHLQAGEILCEQGRPALAVYPVRTGGLKGVYESQLGWRQVSRFFMPGDVPGLEAHDAPAYGISVVALQDTECCVIPVEAVQAGFAHADLRAAALDIFRRQTRRQSELLIAIGSMKAAQRLAMLLLDLAGEQARRGMADSVLTLTMTRNDIASYLGLTLETVSRLLSRFRSAGLITVRHRLLRIVDEAGLAAVHADPERVTFRNPGVD